MRRGWITQAQFSSLFPGPRQRPAPQETVLDGFGADKGPPDTDWDDWGLTPGDEEDKADMPPGVEPAQPDRTDEEMLPDAGSDDWNLTLSDDEDKSDVPAVERARPGRADEKMPPGAKVVDAIQTVSGTASTPPLRDVLATPRGRRERHGQAPRGRGRVGRAKGCCCGL